MSSLLSGLTDFVKQNAITGNQYVDAIIITNIIPIIIAYISGLFTAVKNNIDAIIKYCWNYISHKLKTKVYGEIICTVKISNSSPIIHKLKSIFMDSKVYPYECRDEKTYKLINAIESTKIEYSYRINEYAMNINTTSSSNNNMISLVKTNGFMKNNNNVKKMFYYKNIYIILNQEITDKSLEKNDRSFSLTDQSLDLYSITIMSYRNNTMDAINISNIINSFFMELNINDDIYYNYSVEISPNIGHYMNAFSNKHQIGSGNLLKYGDSDNKIYHVDNMVNNLNDINTKFEMNATINNINSTTENLEEFIKLEHKNCMEKENSATRLYKKYFFKDLIVDCAVYYYYKNGVLYILSWKPYIVSIVKKGSMINQVEIKNEITNIIKLGLKYFEEDRKNRPTNNNKCTTCLYKYVKAWSSYNIEKRDFDTVYLPDDLINDIKTEVENFMSSAEFYKTCDIPYRKGFLFFGKPGTVKTSCIRALSYEYQMNIYTINLNNENVNDDTIQDILNAIGGSSNKILLFEDVDSAFVDKEKIKMEAKDNMETDKDIKEKKYLTYAGLLNALDGLLSDHKGVITIMTTNHPEKLGEALIRPGRIDRSFCFKECNRDQIIKMIKQLVNKYLTILEKRANYKSHVNSKFMDKAILNKHIDIFADNVLNGNDISNFVPAKLQAYIIKYIENFDNCFNNYKELL